MTFELQDKNKGKIYDMQMLLKHQSINHILISRSKSVTLRLEKRLNLLNNIIGTYDDIRFLERKMSSYRKELEDLEEKVQSGTISEMEYLTKSKDLVPMFKQKSTESEIDKRKIQFLWENYIKTFDKNIPLHTKSLKTKSLRARGNMLYYSDSFGSDEPDSDD